MTEQAHDKKTEFVRVARSGQVPEGIVRRFYSGEHEFAVARLKGKAYATSNYCTHLDCLLSSGKLRDDGIGCSCHGSAFDLETGEPISPPATEPIKTHPVEERDGEIFVGVDPAEAPAGPTRRLRRQAVWRSVPPRCRRRAWSAAVTRRRVWLAPASWQREATPSTPRWRCRR